MLFSHSPIVFIRVAVNKKKIQMFTFFLGGGGGLGHCHESKKTSTMLTEAIHCLLYPPFRAIKLFIRVSATL